MASFGRSCDNCGNRVAPGVPRKDVAGKKWCPACVKRQGGGSVFASSGIHSLAYAGDEVFDYKPDRPLTGNGAQAITAMMPGTRMVHLDRVPFNDALHAAQGTSRAMGMDDFVPARKSAWEQLPVTEVPLSSHFVVTQNNVNTARIQQLVDDPSTGGNSPLWMVRYQGDLYTINGHHRLVADYLRSEGKGSIKARIMNLDGKVGHRKAATLDTQREALVAFGMHADALAEMLSTEVVSTFQRIAHDSGDGETIYHCPFCGGGSVVAGSDGTVECSFCDTHFTVQVQPKHNAMPQTVNGVPVPMPGMPGDPTAATGGGDDPNAAVQMGQDGGPPSTLNGKPKGQQSPDAGGSTLNGKPKGGFGGGDASPPPAKKPEGGGNPFGNKKSVYVNRKGVAMGEDAFVRHLALLHASDRQSALEQVRAANTREN